MITEAAKSELIVDQIGIIDARKEFSGLFFAECFLYFGDCCDLSIQFAFCEAEPDHLCIHVAVDPKVHVLHLALEGGEFRGIDLLALGIAGSSFRSFPSVGLDLGHPAAVGGESLGVLVP